MSVYHNYCYRAVFRPIVYAFDKISMPMNPTSVCTRCRIGRKLKPNVTRNWSAPRLTKVPHVSQACTQGLCVAGRLSGRRELATEKHEYLNGFVYPCNMAGAGDAHVKISLNAAALIKDTFTLRGSGCSTCISDMRVRVNAKDKAWFFTPM